MGFTKAVSACNQRNCFFIIHCHAAKSITDIFCSSNRIRITIRTFGVYIDQTHLHGSKWFFQVAGMNMHRLHHHLIQVRHALLPHLRNHVHNVWSPPSHVVSAPQYTSSSGSHTSARPPAKPNVLKPIDSSATLPARIIRSAQEILRPYFCLMGQSNLRALSRLTLSGQLLSGAKRCCPAPAPPRPSPTR